MIKIKPWTAKEAQQELYKRLNNAKDYRKGYEDVWRENEFVTYATRGQDGSNGYNLNNASTQRDYTRNNADNVDIDTNVSYIQKNVNFLQAQMSANPPTVTTRPTSSDIEDRRRADAADRLCRHALRAHLLQEKQDLAALSCIVYGTGFLRILWDGSIGDIIDFDEESNEAILEGGIHVTQPSTWDIYLDPDAETWDDVKYLFHRQFVPLEEAIYRYPEHKDYFVKSVQTHRGSTDSTRSSMNDKKYDVVELFEYWEKGLPYNGYAGRYAVCDANGMVFGEVKANPHSFVSPGVVSKIYSKSKLSDEQKDNLAKRLPVKAELPFKIFTYLDMPNNVYGRSVVSYAAHLQENLNSLDGMTLDSIAMNATPRLVLPAGSEIAEDALSNSPVEFVKIDGAQPPFNIQPGNVANDVHMMRDRTKAGIDESFGVNESMFGQINRETAGTALQYATNQGNMLRRRVFNKYVLFVESIYKTYLNLVRKHWTDEQRIEVLGEEKEIEAFEIKGADIDGGFDLVVEYGAAFSLDPMTRREEIMMLAPFLKEAGVTPTQIVKRLRLNEIEGIIDGTAIAERRQAEIFETMIYEQGLIIKPERYQDHQNMIAYALQWFMTKAFLKLPTETQERCRQHIDLRKEMAAEEQAPAPGGGEAAPPPSPAPGGMGAPVDPGPAGAMMPLT